jgi:ACS family glucarate transporter-like MFS transporter
VDGPELYSDRLLRRGASLAKARKVCLVGGMLFSSVIALAVVVSSVFAGHAAAIGSSKNSTPPSFAAAFGLVVGP